MVLDPSHAATACLCQEKRDPWPLSQYPPVIVNYRMEPTPAPITRAKSLKWQRTRHGASIKKVLYMSDLAIAVTFQDWRAQMTRPAMPLHGGNPVHAVRDSEKLGRNGKYCEWPSSMDVRMAMNGQYETDAGAEAQC